MTDQTPIKRAAQAIAEAESQGRVVPTYELAQIAYETIDPEQLAKVIEAYKSRGIDSIGIAHAIQLWLTRK